jgi:hypothetical protein
MVELLATAAALRKRFLAELTSSRCFFLPKVTLNAKSVLALGWHVERRKRTLLVVANVDYRNRRRCVVEGLPAAALRRSGHELLLEAQPDTGSMKRMEGQLRISLAPGDVKVILT